MENNKICNQLNCEQPIVAKGLCANHYYTPKRQAARAVIVASRVCAFDGCGNALPEGSTLKKKFCSRKCIDAARTLENRNKIKEELSQRFCVQCGNTLKDRKSLTATTCSNDCRAVIENNKKAEKLRSGVGGKICARESCHNLIPSWRKGRTADFCSKSCGNWVRKHRPGQKERQTHMNRKWRYGITGEEVDALLDKQGGGCAICGSKEKLELDHDHSCCPGKTSCGKCIRGILCSSHNYGLGCFKDNIEELQLVIDYLKKFQSTI